MKKYLILVMMIFSLLLVGCNKNNFGLEFKKDYESLNGTTNPNGKEHRTVSIPNGALANSSLVNYSKEKDRRLDIILDVSYDNAIDDVRKCLNTVINKEKRINKEKDIFVRLTNYKDSSMEYTIRVWVDKDEFWNTKFDLLENIKKEFDKE